LLEKITGGATSFLNLILYKEQPLRLRVGPMEMNAGGGGKARISWIHKGSGTDDGPGNPISNQEVSGKALKA